MELIIVIQVAVHVTLAFLNEQMFIEVLQHCHFSGYGFCSINRLQTARMDIYVEPINRLSKVIPRRCHYK